VFSSILNYGPMADTEAPWATGPGEILRHALKLLAEDSDTNRRLAMILIDNAVELMLKTYLGLPRRVTGIKIGRDKFREISESFPKLLDAAEEHANDKLTGIDLGQVEWYHRLRNELYHQGNGLTVERQKVDVYAELALLLFKNLFDAKIVVEGDAQMNLLGAFMTGWQRAERAIQSLAPSEHGMRPLFGPGATRFFEDAGADDRLVAEYNNLRRLRNEVVHGQMERDAVTRELVDRVDRFAEQVESLNPKNA
jgi:hypothetical protein